jgi:hypothetical protein
VIITGITTSSYRAAGTMAMADTNSVMARTARLSLVLGAPARRTTRPCDPFCSGVSCDAEPQNLSPAVPHNQQSIQQANEIVGTTNKSIAAMPSAWL